MGDIEWYVYSVTADVFYVCVMHQGFKCVEAYEIDVDVVHQSCVLAGLQCYPVFFNDVVCLFLNVV